MNSAKDVIDLVAAVSTSGSSNQSQYIAQGIAIQELLSKESGVVIESGLLSSLHSDKKRNGKTTTQAVQSTSTADVESSSETKLAKIAAMYASEIQEIRKDPAFVGSPAQIEYLRDVLHQSSLH